jgi:hypothetical protein
MTDKLTLEEIDDIERRFNGEWKQYCFPINGKEAMALIAAARASVEQPSWHGHLRQAPFLPNIKEEWRASRSATPQTSLHKKMQSSGGDTQEREEEEPCMSEAVDRFYKAQEREEGMSELQRLGQEFDAAPLPKSEGEFDTWSHWRLVEEIERLKQECDGYSDHCGLTNVRLAQAYIYNRTLRAENERLREALGEIASFRGRDQQTQAEIARAALQSKGE